MEYDIEQNESLLSFYEGGNETTTNPEQPATNPEGPAKEEKTPSEYAKEAIARQNNMNAIRQRRQAEQNPDDEGEMLIEDIERRRYSQIAYISCTYFWVYAAICFLIILLCEIYRHNTKPCGIAVIEWIEIFFFVILGRAFAVLQLSWIVRCGVTPKFIVFYYGLCALLALIASVGWIIYGYIIYFSDANDDCQSNTEIFPWLVFMVIILFFGFFMMLMLVLVLFALCLFLCFYKVLFPDAEESGTNVASDLIGGLTKKIYDPEQFTTSKECAICMIEYEKTDQVTALKCDPKHYFHTECISKNIQNGNYCCPLCRKPISEDVAAQMESPGQAPAGLQEQALAQIMAEQQRRQQAAMDTRPPREKYAEQLNIIKEMGFADEEAIVIALETSLGNVEMAVAMLSDD